MPSQNPNDQTAETRFRQAFERLKSGELKVLTQGAAITQNNVAREAGCDPTALKKSRFLGLVREIQAFKELQEAANAASAEKERRRRANRKSLKERLDAAERERDAVQSRLASANRYILDLMAELRQLRGDAEGS